MHMSMWFSWDLGEFLFSGLNVSTRWAFALTWIVLFFIAVLFEGSKVYLARVQRDAYRKLMPYRSDERRNLLCERERQTLGPTSSRTGSAAPVSRWDSFRLRTLVNGHQTLVFTAHNAVGYLLMLAVMLYNGYLVIAVVLGMTLGYFLFGTQLTLLRMQCVGRKRVIICTPECDDTAENSTPPLLDSTQALDSGALSCQTRSCARPAHYHRAAADGAGPSCQFGARACPSRVARARSPPSCSKDEGAGVEDAQLLRQERGCCAQPEPPPEQRAPACCTSSQTTTIVVHESERPARDAPPAAREESPQVSCCRKELADSRERIVRADD